MTDLKNYITKLLGMEFIERDLKPEQLTELPFYIREIYKIKTGFLLNREILILEQKFKENLTTDQYRKQITLVENLFNLPVILVLSQLEAFNRKRLIEKRIAFIIPGKQMFVPQFFIDLREYKSVTQNKKETLQPAAQCILFFYLLKMNIENLNLKEIAKRTNYTQMTVTRAAKELEEKNLCQIEGKSEKRIVFPEQSKTLWEKAKPFLINPVKNKIYINDYIGENIIFRAGITALSELTDLADEPVKCFAISKTDYMYLEKNGKTEIENKPEGQFSLEIWKYAPALLAENGRVDRLSLYLSMKELKDERVEMAIEKMVECIW